MHLQDQMRRMRHLPIGEQANHLNQMLRGHYAYYGIAGNFRALQRVHRAVERYWRKMLSSRSWKGVIAWVHFQRIKEHFPLLRPKLHLSLRRAASYRNAVKQLPKSVVRETRTLRSVGAGGGQPPLATQGAVSNVRRYRDRVSFNFSLVMARQ